MWICGLIQLVRILHSPADTATGLLSTPHSALSWVGYFALYTLGALYTSSQQCHLP